MDGWTMRVLASMLPAVLLVTGCPKRQGASPGETGDGGRGAGPGATPEGMVWIEGGEYEMGSKEGHPDEQPVHKVRVNGFWMDETEVTNAQFARFVEETGYITVCERKLKQADFPGAGPDDLKAGGFVFSPGSKPADPDADGGAGEGEGKLPAYWKLVPGANWRQPEGPGGSIDGKGDLPVVCVAHGDARAYASWAGKRLPTEAEWEWAARGGLTGKKFAWGDEFAPGGKWMANTWQGEFPYENSAKDGFAGLAPVKAFPPNPLGLFDMIGNVWEMCSDYYQADYYKYSRLDNPRGPKLASRIKSASFRAMRGGAFLSSPGHCGRFTPSGRMPTDSITGTNHKGFRCVITPTNPEKKKR